MQIHVNIISWSTRNEDAARIAARLVDHADQLSVIYSTKTGEPFRGAGDWVQVPDEDFYGRKHAVALRLHRGGIFLQIQADTHCPDWPALVKRCRTVHTQLPLVGVWSAEVDNSGYPTEETKVGSFADPLLTIVSGTDAIVWSMVPGIVNYVRSLDYADNNLGWGADWAALCHAYCHGMVAVRDAATPIHHPVSRGYSYQEAADQMRAFLARLRPEERVMHRVLHAYIQMQRVRNQAEQAAKTPSG